MRKSPRTWAEQRGLVSDAGLPIRLSAEGRIRRPVHLELDGPPEARRLRWAWPVRDGESPPDLPPLSRSLWEFVSLADAPDERILAFARRCGVLDLCERHAAPSVHRTTEFGADWVEYDAIVPLLPREEARDIVPPCRPLRVADGRYGEPLANWRVWSRRFRATVNLAAALNVNVARHGDAADWESITRAQGVEPWADNVLPSGKRLAALPLDAQRDVLASLANEWVELGGVTPAGVWRRAPQSEVGKFQLLLDVKGGLFGVIAAHLLAVVLSDAAYPCSRCGAAYGPKRKPRSDRMNYCDSCRSEAKMERKRESARRRRARERGA
jgi:hypothetical protein